MLRPSDTVSIEFVRGMLSGLEASGDKLDGWLVEAGIEPALVDQDAARVTPEQYVALFALLMDRLDDEFLGLLGRPLRRGSFALMLRSMLGAATLAHALRRLIATVRLMQDDFGFALVKDGGLAGLRVVFRSDTVAYGTFLHELLLRVFWRLIVWLHGGRLRPSRFDFAFPAPRHAGEYPKVFPGAVRFDENHTTVWFDGANLALPMLRDEAAMREFLSQAPGVVIVPRRSDHAVGTRVRAHLRAQRPAWPDLAATAVALNLSTSTLQRHLAAEGLSYQAVKDQLRLDLAIARLNTSTVPLTTLALELGFADSPAFQRAFKQWTGSAPGSYRRGRST
jgi:AraC-like DNA-binding protein